MPRKSFTLPRGMRDFDQGEMIKRRWIDNIISDVAETYGFQRVDPSPIELLETLVAKSGPDIKKEIYYFKDKAQRDLGLRFDLTVGMTRMVASRQDLPEPTKLYAISGMWRYDEPQFARYRYFHQWDMEIYGSESLLADAETISASIDILEKIGLKDYQILINDRLLIDRLLQYFKITDENQRLQVLRLIDKMHKISSQNLKKDFLELGLEENTVMKLLNIISMRGDIDKNLNELESIPKLNLQTLNCIEKIQKLTDALKAYSKYHKCFLDLSIVRGIDYYDGIVFEAYDKEGGDLGALLGGGRYDRLGYIYGKKKLPATGVAGGIERLILSMERKNLFPQIEDSPKIFVTIVKEQVKNLAIEVAQRIRDTGVACDIELKNRNLRRQLEYVNSIGIPYLLILGPKEAQNNQIRIRDMKSREETLIPLSNLEEWIKKIFLN